MPDATPDDIRAERLARREAEACENATLDLNLLAEMAEHASRALAHASRVEELMPQMLHVRSPLFDSLMASRALTGSLTGLVAEIEAKATLCHAAAAAPAAAATDAESEA